MSAHDPLGSNGIAERVEGVEPFDAPTWVRRAIAGIESSESLDSVGRQLGRMFDLATAGRPGSLLRGDWVGHAVHPPLTDLPIGFWTSASVLDLLGGRKSRTAATHLVGAGLVATVPTVAAGMAEYTTINEPRNRRTAIVHAAGNTVAMGCYLASWRARRRGNHVSGVVLALVGATAATASGYLGGHLLVGRGVGTGERGLGIDEPAHNV